jgi:hypothetical protein
MATKNSIPVTRADSYYGRSTIRNTLKASAPAKAVPPSVRPLKTSYSKVDQKNQLFGGFGEIGLMETPSLLGMGKVVKPRNKSNKLK